MGETRTNANEPACVGGAAARSGWGDLWTKVAALRGTGSLCCGPEPELGDQPLGAEVPWTPQVDWLLLSKETLPVDRGGYALLLLLLPW
jgi:hypothetical protein